MSEKCCGICCAASLPFIVMLVVLIAISFKSLNVEEYGLCKSSWSKTIEDEPYTNGRHFIGPFKKFVKYPNTLQSIIMSDTDMDAVEPAILSRTKDGVEVSLEISFQYQLILTKLRELYFMYGEEHERIIKYVAIDGITDMATEFTAYEFFNNRTAVDSYMQDGMVQKFNSSLSGIGYLQEFQLRDYTLPPDFEAAIEAAEVARQDATRITIQRDNDLIEAQTRQFEVEKGDAVIARQTALAMANNTVVNNTRDIQQFNFTQSQNMLSFGILQDNLELSSCELIEYMKTTAVIEHVEGNTVLGLDLVE